MQTKLLIIDDEEKLRGLLAQLLRLEGFIITEAGNLKAAIKAIEKEEPDIILCDVKLPDGNGVAFIKDLKIKHPAIEIIMLTAYGNIPDGIQAMKYGAFDYITKGNDNDRIIPLLNQAKEKAALQKRFLTLEKQAARPVTFDAIIGQSKSIQNAISLARKVATTDAIVLLLGETGTGKEVFAHAIHNAGGRSNNAFLALNCSSFSKELLESEIFGHKAGAFTGAIKDKRGLIEEADHGTLFLDEIGEMPIDLQSKLLRVLETSEFIKVGDTRSTKVNVRFIAATNRELEKEVKEGKFREDLYYRLNVFAILLPPLRERKGDIALLIQYYITFFSAKINKTITGISGEAKEILMQSYWKGNIRELKNTIERAVILQDGDQITADSLTYEIHASSSAAATSYDLASMEKQHIQKVLTHTNWNKTETARLLNIGLTTLYRKIEEYAIK